MEDASYEDGFFLPNTNCDVSPEKMDDENVTSHGDRVELIHTRRYFDRLEGNVSRKEYFVRKTREELNRCLNREEYLLSERNAVQVLLREQKEFGNMASINRLQLKVERADMEIRLEKKLEAEIRTRLDRAEYEMNEAELEQGKHILADADLQSQEIRYMNGKTYTAGQRRKREVSLARQTEIHRKSEERADQCVERERARKHRLTVAEAQRCGETSKKFLESTLNKIRVANAENLARSEESIQRRINTVMSLKQSITANKDSLGAIQTRDKALDDHRVLLFNEKMNDILNHGVNPHQAGLMIERKNRSSNVKELFDWRREVDQTDIVKKILNEELLLKKRTTQQPQLLHDTGKEKIMKIGEGEKQKRKGGSRNVLCSADSKNKYTDVDVCLHRTLFSSDEEKHSAVDRIEIPQSESEAKKASVLARVEFDGLWDENRSPIVKQKVQANAMEIEPAKAEQVMFDRVTEKYRTAIDREQIVVRKEFSSVSFYSAPDVIHFKDFDVGEVYQKKVALTNISYGVNHCKLLGITDALKDFVQIQFNPTGQMSAGLTCKMMVAFKPMINEDIEGAVNFQTLTGPFSVPLRCTTKKCDLSLDVSMIEFGSAVIGETVRKYFTLFNNGAASTMYQLLKSTDVTDPPMKEFGNLNDHAEEEFSLGQITCGTIEPFSCTQLEIVWRPTVPGSATARFTLQFDDINSSPLNVIAVAEAVDVPVWVERREVDFKICMCDRLYQDTIIVHNRATTALKLKFEICQELTNHIELLPKTGYIQAQSTFSAQLKFLPRDSIHEDAGSFFDAATGVLEVPLTIRIADQTRSIPFIVHAVVTNSDLSFDVAHIDFGHATIYERVKRTVKLTNHSMLPQTFGFVGLPKYVEVQPNEGFGALLPFETVTLDVILSPRKPTDYNFQLTLKTVTNREFKMTCSAIGVHPPLKLSENVVHFKATSVSDMTTTAFHIVNDHTNLNEFAHSVPRIGKGGVCPVGPTSFEFVVPEGAPIVLSPCVGTVLPGQKMRVQVRFSPTLESNNIKAEAVEVIRRNIESRRLAKERILLEEDLEKQQDDERHKATEVKECKTGKEKFNKSVLKKIPESTPQVSNCVEDPAIPEWGNIDEMSDEYAQARSTLLRNIQPELTSYLIPCYVGSGCSSNPGQVEYSIHNNLQLVVHCPVIKPEMVVISDHGRQCINFGDVARGQSVVESVTVQNISTQTLDLRASMLDTNGSFLVLNSFRPLDPEGTHTVLVSFTPGFNKKYHEVLKINTGDTTLHLTLTGRGVCPRIELNIDGVLDMGTVIIGEYVEKTFKIMNSSQLAIYYAIKMRNISSQRHSRVQDLPGFLHGDVIRRTELVGAKNCNGQSVFNFVPAEGNIQPGENQEITVTFSPDHDSDFYTEEVGLELFNEEETHSFKIIGQSKSHIMYMSGGNLLNSNLESMSALPTVVEVIDAQPTPKKILLHMYSATSGDNLSIAKSEIFVGCVRTMAVSQKKNGEFYCENPSAILAKGFTVEPQKGQVEAGTKKSIIFTWSPTERQDPNVIVEAHIMFTVKGDTTDHYSIMLRGHIVTNSSNEGIFTDVTCDELSDPAK